MPQHLAFSISATTRPQRQYETDGKDYYFITKDEFKQRIAHHEFVEWEEVYDGNYYGTLKSEITRIFQQQKHVLFDVDVEGATSIKRIYGNDALTIFVQPPSVAVLRQRLLGRNSETNHTLEQRIQKATIELQYANRFDMTLVNDHLATAKAQAVSIVTHFLQTNNCPT